jgi:hypothetical protein
MKLEASLAPVMSRLKTLHQLFSEMANEADRVSPERGVDRLEEVIRTV